MSNTFSKGLPRSGYTSVATGKGIINNLPGNLPSTGYVPIVSQDCLRNSVIPQNLVNPLIDKTSDNTEQLELFCEAPKTNMVTFQCPKCNHVYRQPQSSHKAGMRLHCPACQLKFTHGEHLSRQQISEKLDNLGNILTLEEFSLYSEHIKGGDA